MKKRLVLILVLCIALAFPEKALAARRYTVLRVLAENVHTDPKVLMAGEDGTVWVTLRNTQEKQLVYNLECCLDGGEGIVPQNPSVYVDTLDGGESREVALPVKVLPSAQPGWVQTDLILSYENGAGAVQTAQYTLWLEVTQPVRLEHSQAILPDKAFAGSVLAFSMDLMNMGKGTLSNVLLTFDFPFLPARQSVLVGEILPGDTKIGATNLLVGPDVLGETEGIVTLTYEEVSGIIHREEIPLSVQIEKKQELPLPEPVEEEPLLPPWLLQTGLVVLGVLVIVLVQVALDKRRRRERDEKLL